jgi:hypothetical protein
MDVTRRRHTARQQLPHQPEQSSSSESAVTWPHHDILRAVSSPGGRTAGLPGDGRSYGLGSDDDVRPRARMAIDSGVADGDGVHPAGRRQLARLLTYVPGAAPTRLPTTGSPDGRIWCSTWKSPSAFRAGGHRTRQSDLTDSARGGREAVRPPAREVSPEVSFHRFSSGESTRRLPGSSLVSRYLGKVAKWCGLGQELPLGLRSASRCGRQVICP